MNVARTLPVVLDARVLSGSGGGPDKTLINSPAYLQRDGYVMHCAYLCDPADTGFHKLQAKASQKQVELIPVHDRGPLDWQIIPRMLEVCKSHCVTVWHGHDYKSNLLGLILKRFWPMRLVTTLHGWVHHTSRTPIYYMIDRLTLRYYEKVICVSDDLMVAARQAGVAPSRLVLLENGIDLNDYRRQRTPAEARQAMGFSPHFTVGAAGRLSPEKGFDILIKAVDQLHRAGLHNLQLLIAGEGDEQANLQRLIDGCLLPQQIQLLGYRSDLLNLYETFDLYALSSYREGLPNVVLEALAMQVPVIATAVNGIPKLIQHESNGILIPPGEISALAESIRRLVHDDSLRVQLAQAGRKTVESRYSFARRMQKLAQIYDAMFQGEWK
ncbi:MAG: glycosyltransferase [Zavarzinella sp.]